MKKILHVVEAFGGGVFMHLANLSNQLCEDNEVYIAYGIRPETHNNFQTYFNKRIHFIEVKNFTSEINFSKDIKAFFEIKEIIKDIKPDITHLHSSKAGALGRWAIDGKKNTMFYSPHGWAFLKKDDSVIKRFLYKAIEKICAFRKCEIIATSQGEYDESIKLSENSFLINNGINMEDLKPYLKETSSYFNFPVVYTIGRICFQKNPSLFNEIAMSLPNIKFMWIGDGEMRSTLTSPNIEIIGWGPRNEALKLSEKASVFLLCSLWEGLPLSLLEAMYLKKVCIVSDVIGNRDVIKTGINGFICHSTAEYTNMINSIFTNEFPSKDIIENAHQDVLSEYNTITMVKKYKEKYNGITVTLKMPMRDKMYI